MAITLSCSCGKTLQVKDEYAGRRVRCPACSDAITVPQPEPQFEVVEDEPPPPPRSAPIRAKVVTGSRDDDDDDDRRERKRRRDDEDRPRGKSRSYEIEEDEEERPRRKKKKRSKSSKASKPEEHSHFAMEKGILNSGVGGGLLAMLVAVIWFVVGLMNDWLFYYPPILFLIGLVAFFKGLMGGNDE